MTPSLKRITSVQNSRVKELVRLREDRRARAKAGLTLVEGYDEISLAASAGRVPVLLVHSPALATGPAPAEASEALEVSETVFRKVAYRENPDGWLAAFRIPSAELDQLKPRDPALVLVLEALEKPGNVGAILRTAEATGVGAVILSDGRADLWNPNAVRASRGAIFTVPAVAATSEEALKWLRRQGCRIVAASPAASSEYTKADLTGPIAIAVGAEDVGLSRFWLEQADLSVRIPMLGTVNSLNASVAAALLLYEVLRQRGRG